MTSSPLTPAEAQKLRGELAPTIAPETMRDLCAFLHGCASNDFSTRPHPGEALRLLRLLDPQEGAR